MSFSDKQNELIKQKITLVILNLDYCSNTFGIAPCTATGTPCYNTYYTCTDKPNYSKTTKEYRFVNYDAPKEICAQLNALPYLRSIEYLPTEIQDDKTITARINIVLMDENDTDQQTDPYWSDRRNNLVDSAGTYLKKLIARNPFYKKRIAEVFEGYVGLTENEYEQRFSGKLSNISREGNTAKIEAADDIADLKSIKYPFKTNVETAEDLGACFEVKNQEDMLKLTVKRSDYAIRTDYKYLNSPTLTLEYDAGSTLSGIYNYIIIAFDQNDNPIGMTAQETLTVTDEQNKFNFTINEPSPNYAAYYQVYRDNNDGVWKYFQTTNLTFSDYGQSLFTSTGNMPEKAKRYLRCDGPDPADLNNWTEVFDPLTLELSAALDDTTGYIKLDEEIIYYDGIVSTTLQNVQRLLHKTKADTPHYTGTNVKLVLQYDAGNPFTILKDLLQVSGIPLSRIDAATIDAYGAIYTGIDFSTIPITKETDAAELVFDLCYALDIKLWVNENGKITCKYNSDETVEHTITDALNIALNSKNVDYNQSEIFTRILFYWGRNDPAKAGSDKDNYSNIHVEVYADAEGENIYDEAISFEKTTTWINEDCGSESEINSYIANLLNKKIKRSWFMRPFLDFEVESKDGSIKDGAIISLSSNAFNDIDGNDFTDQKAEVIKKEPKENNRVGLTVRLLPTADITTDSEYLKQLESGLLTTHSFKPNEIKVTGFQITDLDSNVYTADNLDVSVDVKLSLEWDNMYASEEETATDILGVTRKLPTRYVYAGMPPHPVGQEVDLDSWQTCRKYKVYLFIANSGQTLPATKRPTTDDANGKWYVAGLITDLKSTDGTKKYKFDFNIPPSFIGRYIGFDVYADTNLIYDSNAPVVIEIGALQ